MRLKTLIPKSEARKIVVQRRAEISDFEIRKMSERIIQKLSSTDDFNYANIVHTYISGKPGEVNTRKLIDKMSNMGKTIVVPKLIKASKSFGRFNFMGWENLVKNSDGYLEPKVGLEEDMSDIDLIIIPAMAISILGQRVGGGGGYYDKLLKQTFAPKFVLAFEFQIFDYIESTSNDIRVDKIITERRIIDTRSRGRSFN